MSLKSKKKEEILTVVQNKIDYSPLSNFMSKFSKEKLLIFISKVPKYNVLQIPL